MVYSAAVPGQRCAGHMLRQGPCRGRAPQGMTGPAASKRAGGSMLLSQRVSAVAVHEAETAQVLLTVRGTTGSRWGQSQLALIDHVILPAGQNAQPLLLAAAVSHPGQYLCPSVHCAQPAGPPAAESGGSWQPASQQPQRQAGGQPWPADAAWQQGTCIAWAWHAPGNGRWRGNCKVCHTHCGGRR